MTFPITESIILFVGARLYTRILGGTSAGRFFVVVRSKLSDRGVDERGSRSRWTVSVATVVFGFGGILLSLGTGDFAFDREGDTICAGNT